MKKSKEELRALIQDAYNKGLVNESTWRHYKGETYVVLDVAIDCNTNEVMVVYYHESDEHVLFTRPLKEWLEETEHGLRFEQVFEYLVEATPGEMSTFAGKWNKE